MRHRLYNIAADYIVNNLLVRDRIGTKPKVVDCYQDFKYEGWSSEEVYEELYKEAKKNGEDFLDKLGEMLDEHLDMDGDGDENDNGEGKDKNGNGTSSKRPKFTEEQIRQLKDDIKKHAQCCAGRRCWQCSCWCRSHDQGND